MVRITIRPDTDASNTGWSDQAGGTTNLYQAIDETTASDTDYIRSSENPTADIIRFRISDPSSAVTEPFNVGYRYGITGSGVVKITARLKQGTTVIKEWVHSDATTTFQTVTQTLTTGEFASISDFNDLFVEFEAAPGGGSAVTWNPLTAVSPIALSNGNLTAALTLPNANNFTATATDGVGASAKKYWEIACDDIDAFSNAVGLGFADGGFVSGSGNFIGSDPHSLGCYNTSGDVYLGGSAGPSVGGYGTDGNILCIAVDTANSKVWFRINGGNWNADVIGNQNPATNTGGISFAQTAPLYPALCFRAAASNTYQVTAKFTSASWTYAAPSGFTQI